MTIDVDKSLLTIYDTEKEYYNVYTIETDEPIYLLLTMQADSDSIKANNKGYQYQYYNILLYR